MNRPGLATVVAVVIAGPLTACAQGNVFELSAGTCFDDPSSGVEVAEVPVVECSAPHDNIVFAAFDLPEGDFPGATAISAAAEDGCLDRFDEWAGVGYDESTYWASYLAPTEESWESAADREIVCYAFDRGGQKLAGAETG